MVLPGRMRGNDLIIPTPSWLQRANMCKHMSTCMHEENIPFNGTKVSFGMKNASRGIIMTRGGIITASGIIFDPVNTDGIISS